METVLAAAASGFQNLAKPIEDNLEAIVTEFHLPAFVSKAIKEQFSQLLENVIRQYSRAVKDYFHSRQRRWEILGFVPDNDTIEINEIEKVPVVRACNHLLISATKLIRELRATAFQFIESEKVTRLTSKAHSLKKEIELIVQFVQQSKPGDSASLTAGKKRFELMVNDLLEKTKENKIEHTTGVIVTKHFDDAERSLDRIRLTFLIYLKPKRKTKVA